MKFMLGYQLRRDSAFLDEIVAQKEHIHEVYFSWGDMPNGRNDQLNNKDFLPFEAQARQIEDLKRLTEEGISLNLLLNGNCYGRDSLSRKFFMGLGDTVDYIGENFSLTSITTTSPMIAKFMKDNFPVLEVRASVNMRIGTVEGMEYVENLFDGYYIQREYNRDFAHLKKIKSWCDEKGKKLYGLANSGCLNYCSAQTFHDNLVAHEKELATIDNAYEFQGMCHQYLKEEKHYGALITNTNFIRPEDISHYEEYFTAMKLATRVSRNPAHILRSYIRQKYVGNILEILEPAHNIYPYVLENGNPLKLVKINTAVAVYEDENIKEKENAHK